MNRYRTMATEYLPKDVEYNPEVIAAAWEAFGDGVPAVAAAALVNEYTEHTVTGNEGEESDRDVLFHDAEVMVEEKAMGVCERETAEKFAPLFIELDRDDGRVLAINPGAIYENHRVPSA